MKTEILERIKQLGGNVDNVKGSSLKDDLLAITFDTDNGENFTALEFLFKSHNQQANKELGDHVFFEGTDEDPNIIDGLPLCYIACGS